MKVFGISDLHLSSSVEKPMDIFGDEWANHFERVSEDWTRKVSPDDLVLLGGDISWGSTIAEASSDYASVAALPGKKLVVRGNHDYYWNSLAKMKNAFPEFGFIQNNCIRVGNVLIAGSRGWTIPDSRSNDEDHKIFNHEILRLELSLSDMQKQRSDGDLCVALLHFPPFDAQFNDSPVTALLEKYKISKALYGHLHGKNVRVAPHVVKNDIEYYLTSCDLIGNKLVEIAEVL